MELTHEKIYTVRAYEVDFKGRAQIGTLLNYLQDIAGEHAARLGVSVQELFRKNMTWVLSRYRVQIYRYPRWGEQVRLVTWPSAAEEIFALRDFEMVDEKGERLLAATSSWLLLDLLKKKPVPLTGHLPQLNYSGKTALLHQFHQISRPDQPDLEFAFRVRMSDLDVNGHVNHVHYLLWALETVPEKQLKFEQPADIEVVFRAEAFYGDRVLCRTALQEGIFHHQIVKEGSGTELTRLTSRWQQFDKEKS